MVKEEVERVRGRRRARQAMTRPLYRRLTNSICDSRAAALGCGVQSTIGSCLRPEAEVSRRRNATPVQRKKTISGHNRTSAWGKERLGYAASPVP